jgi:hypothetical protein
MPPWTVSEREITFSTVATSLAIREPRTASLERADGLSDDGYKLQTFSTVKRNQYVGLVKQFLASVYPIIASPSSFRRHGLACSSPRAVVTVWRIPSKSSRSTFSCNF